MLCFTFLLEKAWIHFAPFWLWRTRLSSFVGSWTSLEGKLWIYPPINLLLCQGILSCWVRSVIGDHLNQVSNHYAGRLNGVVSPVTVFEELSHVMSPFLSCDKANSRIPLFYKQDFRSGRRTCMLLCSVTYGTSLFFQIREVVSGFHLFVEETFLHVPQMHCDSFIAWNRNLVPSLYVVELKVI